jgi:uncharacterized protein YbaR (Trm112 family)
MNHAVISILQCPVQKTALHWCSAAELEVCNTHITNGAAQYLDGSRVEQVLSAALTNADKSIFYRVHDGDILVLLPVLAIQWNQNRTAHRTLSAETQAIKAFYDQIGWEKRIANTLLMPFNLKICDL